MVLYPPLAKHIFTDSRHQQTAILSMHVLHSLCVAYAVQLRGPKGEPEAPWSRLTSSFRVPDGELRPPVLAQSSGAERHGGCGDV